jgi:hypothetical protein
MHGHLRLLTVLAVVAATAACGMSSEGSSSPTPAPQAPGTASGSPSVVTTSVAPTGSVPVAGPALPAGLREEPRVVAAIEDTAGREGVEADRVVIAAWSPVTWSDGSLGCPQKGMSYTQATVEGELLILRVALGLFQYHARTGGPYTYCADPSAGYSVG